MTGWIKLHRKFIKWEWFTDVNTCHLFQYLLLEANHKETKWRGHIIAPGQLLTGRVKIALETGLSERNVRTSLDKLKSTKEVTSRSYNRYSIITICKWKEYQQVDQQPTTSNNVNNIKNDKEERNALSIFKNKILNEEMKKFAEDKGVFGKQLETSWQRFLIKKGNAMIERKCSYEQFFADWQLWILYERVDEVTQKEGDALVGEELKIQHLGSAAWRRKNKMSLNPEQKRFLDDYEAANGNVWWDNLRQFKENKKCP